MAIKAQVKDTWLHTPSDNWNVHVIFGSRHAYGKHILHNLHVHIELCLKFSIRYCNQKLHLWPSAASHKICLHPFLRSFGKDMDFFFEFSDKYKVASTWQLLLIHLSYLNLPTTWYLSDRQSSAAADRQTDKQTHRRVWPQYTFRVIYNSREDAKCNNA